MPLFRPDFEVVADILGEYIRDNMDELTGYEEIETDQQRMVNRFADWLAGHNSKFNREKWIGSVWDKAGLKPTSPEEGER